METVMNAQLIDGVHSAELTRAAETRLKDLAVIEWCDECQCYHLADHHSWSDVFRFLDKPS